MRLYQSVGVVLGGLSLCSTMALAVENEPEKPSPVRVVVTGAEDALADNLKSHLPSLRHLKCDTPKERVDSFIGASQDKLTEGAEAMGYFSAGFDVAATRQNNCWVLNIATTPGLPVVVDETDLKLTGEGRSQPDFGRLVADPPYRPGDVLVSQKYEDMKAELAKTASRLGYFDAKFVKREIQVDIDTHRAVIHLHFDTGARYQLGEVSIDQDVLDEKFINRYLRLKPGTEYDSDALLQQQRILEGSNYYSEVRISSRFQNAENNRVPVEITATRRKRYSYTGTLGYATDTGLRIETGMEAHWINRKGHKLDVGLRLSQQDPAVRFNYKVPLWQPEHEFASVAGGWSKKDNDDIKSEAQNLELNYNRRSDDDWQQTLFVSFLDEETQVKGVGGSSVRSQLTLFGARASKTVRDHSLFPTQGWRVQAEVKGAHDAVLSDQSLLQASAQGKYLHTFENKDKLILQAGAGTTFIDELTAMPGSLRFFAGGQSSVRGYDFESIGELDGGAVIGGKHLLTAGIEYEHPVTEKISAAAFVDAGSAFDQWNDYSMSVGVGVGARYKSPLGPVRVDFAVPTENTSDLHFYFSLGPDL